MPHAGHATAPTASDQAMRSPESAEQRYLPSMSSVALAMYFSLALSLEAAELTFEGPETSLTLPEGEVLAASPTSFHGEEMVSISLSIAAAGALTAFTARHVGQPVTTWICGYELRQEAWIVERIGGRTGLIQLADRDQSTAVAEILNGVATCDRLARLVGE